MANMRQATGSATVDWKNLHDNLVPTIPTPCQGLELALGAHACRVRPAMRHDVLDVVSYGGQEIVLCRRRMAGDHTMIYI